MKLKYIKNRQAGFTLLELLVSMAVLAILMLGMFRFFASAQQAWASATNTAEVYEKARIAFDVVTRDLQSAVANEEIAGQHIHFHQDSPSSIWFVTMGEGSFGAESPLIEVGYRHQDYQFQRAFTDDTNANWNIYGDRSNAATQDGYQRIVDGVIAETFVCYEASSTFTAYTPNGAGLETSLPGVVDVTFTILDNNLFKLWQQLPVDRKAALEKRGARTFSKTIFLNR